MKALLILGLISYATAFFDIKSFYEKYEFYYNHSSFLQHCEVGVKPIARLVIGASSNIKKSSTILKVPSTHILTTFDAFPWSKPFENETHSLKAEALIVSYKLLNTSFFSEYIHQFPWTIDAPSAWLIDELMTYLHKFIDYPEEIDEKLENYERFKNVLKKIPAVRGYAFEKKNFAWAQNFVRTYSIPITLSQWKTLHRKNIEKGDENVQGLAFVPFFELFNQYTMPDIYYSENNYPFQFVPGYFELSASRDFSIGEQIYMPYIRKNNHRLLMDSGLNLEENSNDRLKIKTEGKTFYLSPLEINQEYLENFKGSLVKYRQGVKAAIVSFKHALRHLRRRVKILDDRHIKLAFKLAISEKVCAYHSLSITDRGILKNLISSLRLA